MVVLLPACGQVDAFGCSLDVLLAPDFSFCEGDTSIITPTIVGASGTFTLLWSNGSTGNFIQIDSGGEYCVTVTDQANCQDADCIIATEIIIPDFTCPVTNESGPGLNDGAINCDALTGIATFLWSNGATNIFDIGSFSRSILCDGDRCKWMHKGLSASLYNQEIAR
jgi:hypothetical protein